MSLIGGYEFVLDGSDNFETRYLVSDAFFLVGRRWITQPSAVRWIADHESGAREKTRGETQSDLSLLVSGAAASPAGACLRRGPAS